MGKSRRNRGGLAHRRDPIMKQVKPPSDPELAALRESKILPVINDLKNADPKSRSAAATAVANLIQDTKCRKLLLREQVVHTVLAQTLTDAALESRAAGWGILQVLAQEEEADFCVHLFRQDILTAIEYAAKTVSEKLQSEEPAFSRLPRAEQSFTTSIAASLVSLLTALAESGDELLEAISANAAVSHLVFTLIARSSQGEDGGVANLRSDALACLMIICEDNAQLAKRVVDSPSFQAMVALKDEADSDGILACAALHNIFAALNGLPDAPHIPDADDSILIPTLTKAVAAIAPGRTATNGNGWSCPVEQQQLALETLASIGTSLNSAMSGSAPQKEVVTGTEGDQDMGEADEPGGSDGEEEDGGGEGGDEMDADAMEADMEMVTGADTGDGDGENINHLPVLKALLQKAVPEVIRVVCMQPTDDDGMRLQSHALSALNNVAWSVSLIDFSDDQNTGIQKAWSPVGRSLWGQVISPILSTDTTDVGLATQVTGLAWAVSRSLGGRTPLKADEHRKFITLYQATRGLEPQDPEDPFQSLGVKCVGVLGQLAIDPAPADLNREIGTFLVTVLASLPDTPAADAVEALNQVFDIYGDEGYAYDKEVFWKDNFLSHLEEVLPKARAMVKTIDKKSKTELRTRADEAVLNLTRFLAYKKKHKP
ncbi:ARM-like repeat-containing protein [Tolypocladium capitatum]|uniref:ARM-like repeat-containing protein n=1 Tax=Tolypocladium capitatum TaxID=45235 RepID=A0A2K3Q894_9HYPO|nr:ARM-like repeat-containing protein [Tolypocladium capitatum]